MAASIKTPYQLLEVHEKVNAYELRVAYRKQIHALNYGDITDVEFRYICRAYETLSDYKKRKTYDTNEKWISELSLRDYTLQQLAAEPSLLNELKRRLRHATLREINAQDSLTGHTPLYCAARVGCVDSVSYLTDQGAEPDIPQRTGSTALHVAAFYAHADVVHCLLESGANYCKLNGFNHTAEKEAHGRRVARVFVDLKQNPFVQAAANQLDWFKNDKEALKKHIDEQYHTQRQTLLHSVCKKDHFELVRWLIEQRSANLDIVDINQNSALHLAAYSGHSSIVEYLLNRGGDSRLINKWGMTAEQEGSSHGNKIIQFFQNMRKLNMFEMARQGIDWWFQYHFGALSSDAIDSKGISLLFYACRYGRISVAKWLLDQSADVNVQLRDEPHSTPLHTACLHGHLETAELLLAYGADVRIKNDYGDTIFYEIKTNAIKQLLRQHERNLHDNKLIPVQVFADDDTGNTPIAKVQLNCGATFDDLLNALPTSSRQERICFSIARRPLYFKDQATTVISALCCARYGHTKFISIPVRLTLHKLSSYTMRKDNIRVDPSFDFCEFNKQLHSLSQIKSIDLKVPLKQRQTVYADSLKFDFSSSCTDKNLTMELRTIFSPDYRTFGLSECICLFKTDIYQSANELHEMPVVSINNEPLARLYTLALPSSYWFTQDTRQTRLPMIGGIHAFVRYVDIIPKLLSLPADMFLASSSKQPLKSRQNPVDCTCLQLRKHNAGAFPHIGYHGTNVPVVKSILMDGLVTPGTVVSSGIRISPPASHIPRGRAAFGVSDFADAIFLSPSVYYSSDGAYATPFEKDDDIVQVVLECSVKTNGFSVHSSTVPTYRAHPSDNLKTIEWRVTDPTQIEINSVLFIPVKRSKKAAMIARFAKLGMDSSILDTT